MKRCRGCGCELFCCCYENVSLPKDIRIRLAEEVYGECAPDSEEYSKGTITVEWDYNSPGVQCGTMWNPKVQEYELPGLHTIGESGLLRAQFFVTWRKDRHDGVNFGRSFCTLVFSTVARPERD